MSKLPNYIIAIGLSAGGLQPLHELLNNLPAELNAALIVVQHLHRAHKSMATSLLRKHTSLPVLTVTNGMLLENGQIYVLAENQMMTYADGCLWLRDRKSEEIINRAIDILMNSMAVPLGNRAISVILSGFNGDGSMGSLLIGQHGGTTIAQLPITAQYPSMPNGAIGVGEAQYSLTPTAIGQLITQIVAVQSR